MSISDDAVIEPMTGICHPAGCRYTETARRQSAPVRRKSIGTFSAYALIAAVIAAFWAAWQTVMIPYRVWHTTGPDGQQVPSTTAWVAYGVIPLVLIVIVKTALVVTARRKRQPVPAPAVEAACEHRGRVEVNNSYYEQVGVKKLEAWWCPDCETQLDADWKPAPALPAPAITPGAGWTWRWWCSCGTSRNGYAAAESVAKNAIDRGVTAHQGAGHAWRSEWRSVA